MKLLVVRYSRQRGSDDPEQARGFLAAAEKIAGLPGLVWKLWGYDDTEHAAESIYLFDSEEHARACVLLAVEQVDAFSGMLGVVVAPQFPDQAGQAGDLLGGGKKAARLLRIVAATLPAVAHHE